MARQRVVVGVSSASENSRTLTWAVAEAAEAGAYLVICFACAAESPLAAPGAGTRMALLELVEPRLARAVAAARLRLGGDRVRLVTRAHPPGELLVGVADQSDLLVVGAPAHPGWLQRASTTHYVVAHARSPVVVVRPSPEAPERDLGRPFCGHVVVGVDGSASAQAAVQFGFGYAVEHRRPLVAVHVTAPDAKPDAAQEILAREVEPWQHKYPDVSVTRAGFTGRALDGILRASDGAYIVAVGDSRQSRVRRVLGSVSHGLVDRSRCPVAVVCGDNHHGWEAGHDPDDH